MAGKSLFLRFLQLYGVANGFRLILECIWSPGKAPGPWPELQNPFRKTFAQVPCQVANLTDSGRFWAIAPLNL